ncbi:p21-C-terminal region-binding protein-domain-containing protein [Gaertneriomyces semiglobifer]|nr:p21-C-terminal region-binding protein-domain-containing protein [Gaertneriomyces semiglobifer]
MDAADAGNRNHADDEDEDDDDDDLDAQTIDVDFEFFDPKPVDFHGLKSLLNQTFFSDAASVPISPLADLIIGQPSVGSTVKVEDQQDPYALMTVLSMETHRDTEPIKAIRAFLAEKCRKAIPDKDVHEQFGCILEKAGLLINERLINMPPQIVPPMLKMLLEEIEWALEDKEPFNFPYYIYISKIYYEVEPTVEEEEGVVVEKKKKKARTSKAAEVFYFQPEDEIIQEYATLKFDYKPSQSQASDSRRAFHEHGIDPSRRVLVIKQDDIKKILERLEEILGAS